MTEAKAKAAARALVARLNKVCAPGWVATVWENCGWHYKASHEDCNFHVFYRHASGYWTLLGDDKFPGAGHPEWGSKLSYAKPEEAVHAQVALAKREVWQRINTVVRAENAARRISDAA